MRRLVILVVAGVILLGLGACAKRSTQYQQDDVLELVRTVPIVGDPLDLSIDGDDIYVAQDQGGFSIINSSTGNVRWFTQIKEATGGFKPLYRIRKISVVSQYDRLFVTETDGVDTIHIIDLAQADTLKIIDGITGATQDMSDMRFTALPTPIGNNKIEMGFTAGRNFRQGLYDNNLWMGFAIDNMSTPASASGFDMNDQYIYIAAQQLGLMIYNKANQQLIGQLSIPGEAQKVKVVGNYAYLAGRQGGFSIVDISNPAAPVLVSNFDTTGYATTVDVSGNLAVISSNSGGIYLFDITSPTSPVLKQRLTDCGYTNNAKFHGDQIVVAARDQGVLIYKIK